MPLSPRRPRAFAPLLLLVAAGAGLAVAAEGPAPARTPAPKPAPVALSAVARIGERMFYDTALSGSGRLACASCHDPANHYAPSNGLAVQIGGPNGTLPGIRAVPTLTYKEMTPVFSIGAEDPTNDPGEVSPMAAAGGAAAASLPAGPVANAAPATAKSGDTSANPVARGGLFWDGRADTLEAQAIGPLMSPFEMANDSRDRLYATIRARYGKALGQLFGPQVLADEAQTLDEASFALARYQVEDPDFHPYDSKYDAYLAGRATLTPAEARGLKLFDDPQKGNCAACHLDRPGADGAPPQFTDYEFEALGLPRNPAIPANADPGYHDLGICGPLREDAYASQPTNCGLFKTPTLRNVATRHVFFHSGVYTRLADVVRFYVDRDTRPGVIYPKGPDGKPRKFDDLPARYQGNIDNVDAPFGGKAGDAPHLDEAEIADIVAFLNTLTDGYRP